MIMAYKFNDVDYEDMDDLALSKQIQWECIESKENQPEYFSMDALDIYDSYYG